VTVECHLINENRVRISFKDVGVGLSQEQTAQLFQPFNRLGQEAGSEEGTGIGLVVTKQLVELMGGTIGVVSEKGVGSTFWVELATASIPTVINDAIDNIDSAYKAIQPDPSKKTLLYIEDNPANLILVEQLIKRRSDLKLLTAINAHLGIELAKQHQPDAILMDINLPGLSGYGALNILQQDPTTAHIPVIALSANAMQRDIEKGMEMGFFQYLTKPIQVREFMDALDLALQHAAELSQTLSRSHID
jgi:CheY-like chemotaxis protein